MLILAAIVVLALLAYRVALQQGRLRLHEAGQQRLEVEAMRLDGQLARFEYLPSLLETSPMVYELFDRPNDMTVRHRVNLYLRALNAIANAENLYVLDADGMALAAADFELAGTPVDSNLSYRPYVRDALAQGRGRFFGVGITSARAGYYLSYALALQGTVRGIATVKVDLQPLEREWQELPGNLVLVDEHQVVILSSHDAWRYHPLEPMSDADAMEAVRGRRYGASSLEPIDWRPRGGLASDAIRVRLDGRDQIASYKPVNHDRWQLILLSDEASALTAARWVAASAALAAAVLLLTLTVAIQRKREIRQRLASQEALQAAHDSLELKVQERTAELRAAQSELVHAGKLSVLGQMSAGMVHELNQPLAALNTLSDNATLLIERGRVDEARANLARIGQLVGRMARLTRQLKGFAHKSEFQLEPVPVRRLVGDALELVAARLLEGGIGATVSIEPEDLRVTCEPGRLEQVLVNLLGNAADALGAVDTVEHGQGRRIEIRASADQQGCRITVSNNGPAIDAAILPRLFEPFATTKPPGSGLGLGLMISSHIVRAFGGTLSASNLAPTGARFTIRLPAVAEASVA